MRALAKLRTASFVFVFCLTSCVASSRSDPQPQKNASKTETPRSAALERIAEVPASLGPLRIQCVGGVLWLHDTMNLWRGENAGTWKLKYKSNSGMGNLIAIQFLTVDVGWMLRLDGLYKTEDAGANWISKNPGALIYPNGDFQAFGFWRDGLVGWAVGGVYRPLSPSELGGSPPGYLRSPDGKGILVAAIYHTIDGGSTWEKQSVPSNVGRLLDVFVLDSDHAMVTGDAGIFRTDNGGKSWLPIKFNHQCSTRTSTTAIPIDISFVDLNSGWLAYNDGYVAKTSDGGRTWCDLTFAENIWPANNEPAYFAKLHFIDLNNGWALGADESLYETKDGGKNWKIETGTRFNDMYFSDSCLDWLVSREGVFRLTK